MLKAIITPKTINTFSENVLFLFLLDFGLGAFLAISDNFSLNLNFPIIVHYSIGGKNTLKYLSII